MENRPRLLRITTVPISLKILLQGQLTFFTKQGFDVLAVSADGPEIPAIEAEGIEHQVVPMTRKITPLHDIVSLFRLISVVRKFRPDIVHTHTPKAGLLGMIAAWICRVPLRLHTVAGLPLMERTGFIKKILILTENITYACATRVYPNSDGLKKYIETFSSAPMKIIGKGSSNGINTSYFDVTPSLELQAREIRMEYGISENDVVFSFVGRIVRDKGIGELVEAFKKLPPMQHGNRYFLMLIGSFEQALDPLQQSDYDFLNNDPSVILTGFKTDIRPYLRASDIFVFPSYREGFPNVVMQAGCLKVPAIVSNINGCNEIVQHNLTGMIVQVKNVEELQHAMLTLSRDRDKQLMLGESARHFIVAHYDQQYIWSELMKEYRQQLR